MTRLIAGGPARAYARKYAPPVLGGLELWHFLDGSVTRGAINFAPGKPDAVVVGAPVASDNSIRFKSQSNFLQTQIEEPTECTIFVVGKTTDTMADDAHRPMFISTLESPAAIGGGNTFGISLGHATATTIGAFASRGTSLANDTSAPVSITDDPAVWSLFTMTVSNTAPTMIRNSSTGVTAVGSSSVQRFRSAGRFRIGSAYNTYLGLNDMALCALYSLVLSADEQAANEADIRAKMAALPTPILGI